MYLLRIIIMLVLSVFVFGCEQTSVSSPEDEGHVAANKALLARFYSDVFVSWDRDLVDELLSPDFRSHDWPVESRSGPDGFWDFYDGVLSAFPDTRYVVDDLIAEGDRVVVHWRLLATQKGEFYGMAPTGKPVSLQGIAIYRVEAGKIMERWVVYDLHGLIEQVKAAASGQTELMEFATRYAAAWSSQDPVAFASLYAKNGSFRINDGEPSVGRDAVMETARGFMTAFPDMVVRLVELRRTGDHVEFHWHWTGINTGPGGTGNAVDLRGYEQWTLDEEGLILQSLGHLDDAEYQRQLNAGAMTID